MVGDAQLHVVCIEIIKIKKIKNIVFNSFFVVVCSLTAMLWF